MSADGETSPRILLFLSPSPHHNRTRRFTCDTWFRTATTFRGGPPASDESIRIRFLRIRRVFRHPYPRQRRLHLSGFHLSTAKIRGDELEPVRVRESCVRTALNRDGRRGRFSRVTDGPFHAEPPPLTVTYV